MKKGYAVGQLWCAFAFTGILIVLLNGIVKAADFEIILGSSSAFNVVRGTTVAGGTSTLYVGSATVSIGTTTQPAMLYIAGSSSANTAASLRVVNTSGTSTLYVRNDGNVGVGTTTPGTALYVIGTITATGGFVGSLAGSDNVNATTISTTSLTAGSATVTTFTTTGSATVTGTLTASNGKFAVDGTTGSATVASLTISSTGTLTAAGGLFKVDETGSMTVKTLAVTGTVTMATSNGNVGIGTTTPSTLLTVGTTTNILNVTSAGNVGIGTTTPQHKLAVSGSMYSPRLALTDPGAAGTITVNWNNSNVQSVAFSNANGNRDIVFTNGQDGGKYILFLKQGSSATSTVSWPATSTVRWAGGGHRNHTYGHSQ